MLPDGTPVKLETTGVLPSPLNTTTVYNVYTIYWDGEGLYNIKLKLSGVDVVLTTAGSGDIILRDQTSWVQSFLPTFSGGTYDYYVNWGDGSAEAHVTTYNGAGSIHTYTDETPRTVTIRGTITGWNYNSVGTQDQRDCLLSIECWGPWKPGNLGGWFGGCRNMVVNATDKPDLTGVTNFGYIFQGCKEITSVPNMNLWDMSNATVMTSAFQGCTNFNQDLSGWNTANVTMFNNMFIDAKVFNGNIGGWNVAKGTDFSDMFWGASAFNSNISGWNVGLATAMYYMFSDAIAFNQDLSSWNIVNVTSMGHMFSGAVSYTKTNYDLLLVGWGAKAVKSGVLFDMNSTTKYTAASAAATARAHLISAHTWTITDGGT